MQYLFGTNIARNDEHNEPDGQLYCKAELPQSMQDTLEQQEQALERAEQNAQLPLPLKILKWVCFVPGWICALGILKGGVTLAEGYRNAPYVYWIAGIGLLVSSLLYLIEKYRGKRVDQRESVQHARRAMHDAQHKADAWLAVPAKTRKVDVLAFDYQEKNGTPTIHGPAVNLEMRAYEQDGAVCLTDGTAVYAIPKDQITALRLIEHSVSLLGWNKDDSPDQDKYKSAGLLLTRAQPSALRYACALEWRDGAALWQLLFPAYELGKFESLTGLRGPKLPQTTPDRRKSARPKQTEQRVRPRFYWTVPREENAAYWFSELSDASFKAEHPVLYGVLATAGILLLVLPMFAFTMAAILLRPDVNSPWILLGGAGGFVMGIGLFNIVAAWLEQYMGHWLTIACLTIGAAMMAAGWLLMA